MFETSKPSSGHVRPYIVMTLFGRCGSFFVHSLFDGHPLLSSIPGMAATQILRRFLIHPELSAVSTTELAQSVTQQIDFYINNPASRQKTGFDRMGDNADEVLGIDTDIFFRHVLEELALRDDMLILPRLNEAMHDAFDLTQYGTTRRQIFFHAHATSHEFACKFLAEIPDYRQFLLLREPVENIESCVNFLPMVSNQRLQWFYNTVCDMMSCQNNSFRIFDDNSVAVRLEDIKSQPEETLRALCEAVALPFDSALLNSSFMGKAYASVPTLRNPQIKGFEDPSKSPQGYRLCQRDRAFFATLFSGIGQWAEYEPHEMLNENEMRAIIINGDLLEVEVDIAASEGIAKEALQGDDEKIAFRQFLAGIPNIYSGPPTKIASRLITAPLPLRQNINDYVSSKQIANPRRLHRSC